MIDRDTLRDYGNAMYGHGPLAARWKSDPEAMMHDLISEIKSLQHRVDMLERSEESNKRRADAAHELVFQVYDNQRNRRGWWRP